MINILFQDNLNNRNIKNSNVLTIKNSNRMINSLSKAIYL